MSNYLKITQSELRQNINYFGYYKNLLVYQNKNLKSSSFDKLVDLLFSGQQPHFFHIKPEKPINEILQRELEIFLKIFEENGVKFSILNFLPEKYGTFVKVFYSQFIQENQPTFEGYLNWLDTNKSQGFISRFPFSTLLPYLFLDVQEEDRILSCGINNPDVCEILLERNKSGYFIINEQDYKSASTN